MPHGEKRTRALLGISIWPTTRESFQATLDAHLQSRAAMVRLYTLNPELMMLGRRNPEYQTVLRQGEWNVVDGIGVALALALNGNAFPERLCGSDLIHVLARSARDCGRPLFLLGGAEDRLTKAIANLRAQYPGLDVLGFSPAYRPGLPLAEEAEIAALLQRTRPVAVAVCLGSPRQEFWIHANLGLLRDSDVGVVAGLGGTVDFLSGEIRRAPRWVRNLGMEWLHRLMQEPQRWRRQLSTLPAFLACVLRDRLWPAKTDSDNRGDISP